MEFLGERKLNLDNVPDEVLRRVLSYLDVGHIVSVAQANRALRNVVVNDRTLWLSRLEEGLKVQLRRQSRHEPFCEIMRHVKKRRCSDCLEMETGRRPFVDLFFRRTLCERCQKGSKYAVVNATTAKKNYFLNEDDLLSLKTMSMENPHHKSGSPVRLYSREQVRKASEEKLKIQGVSREERLQQQEQRRLRGVEAYRRGVKSRKRELLRVLNAQDLIYLRCRLARSFIHGGWRNKRDRIRWTVEDVVAHFHEKHEVEVIEVE